jgi:hypothetical protein
VSSTACWESGDGTIEVGQRADARVAVAEHSAQVAQAPGPVRGVSPDERHRALKARHGLIEVAHSALPSNAADDRSSKHTVNGFSFRQIPVAGQRSRLHFLSSLKRLLEDKPSRSFASDERKNDSSHYRRRIGSEIIGTNASGKGTPGPEPHLQRPYIRMQPESCHHAEDAFAQGLRPYMEIPAELNKRSTELSRSRATYIEFATDERMETLVATKNSI